MSSDRPWLVFVLLAPALLGGHAGPLCAGDGLDLLPSFCAGTRVLEVPPIPGYPSALDRPLGTLPGAGGPGPKPAEMPAVPFAAGGPFKADSKTESDLGTLTGKVVVQEGNSAERWHEPLVRNTWQAEQAWRLDLAGPLFAFGQLGGNSDEAAQRDMKVSGRTGLACKVSLGSEAEFVLRGGPGVSYTDPLRPERTLSQADWQLEVQARCPLLFGIGLEYQGTAVPALSPLERDRVNQDLHLAFPVGSSGKMQVGARHQWQSSAEPKPWADGMQLYLGLQLTR